MVHPSRLQGGQEKARRPTRINWVAKDTEEANWRAVENDMLSDYEHFQFLPLLIPIIYADGRFIIARLPELYPDSFDEPPVTIPAA